VTVEALLLISFNCVLACSRSDVICSAKNVNECFLALYKLFVCVCLLNHFLIFFLSYFLFFLYFLPLLFICLLVYFLTYLLFLSRIESLFVGRRFVGGNKTWLQFFGFILFCSRHIFCYQCMFAFIVFVLVFSVLGQEIGWEDRL